MAWSLNFFFMLPSQEGLYRLEEEDEDEEEDEAT